MIYLLASNFHFSKTHTTLIIEKSKEKRLDHALNNASGSYHGILKQKHTNRFESRAVFPKCARRKEKCGCIAQCSGRPRREHCDTGGHCAGHSAGVKVATHGGPGFTALSRQATRPPTNGLQCIN